MEMLNGKELLEEDTVEDVDEDESENERDDEVVSTEMVDLFNGEDDRTLEATAEATSEILDDLELKEEERTDGVLL